MPDAAIDEGTIFVTPLVEIDLDLTSDATVLAKLEWYNLYDAPHGGGSIKSRIAKGMLDGAEERGELSAGTTVIEPTSGNTGSEIARLATARGYDVEIVMPDNAAGGKIDAVRDAGAEIHFVDANLGYDAVIERCDAIIDSNPDRYFHPNQYENPDNPGIHERTTAPEIYDQTDHSVTHIIAGVGTGGTITGTGRGLNRLTDDDVTIVGFEPEEPLHAIDGLKYLKTGDHYHPGTYDESVLDQKEYVTTTAAYDRARELRSRYFAEPPRIYHPGQHSTATVADHLCVDDQFVVGTSSGGGVQVVTQLDARGELDDDAVAVVVFADRGDKYADIALWEEFLDGE